MIRFFTLVKSNEFLIFLVFFTIQIIFARPLLGDFDVGWHLKTGEYIVNHLSIPSHDPWSFSATQIWYNISWLWDVLSFLAFDLLGFKWTEILNITLYSALLAISYRMHIAPLKVSSKAKVDTIIIAGLVIYPFAFFRPQAIALYAVSLCMWIFKHRNHRVILWFPMVMILWQNIHGSFIIGYTIAGAFLLEEIYSGYSKKGRVKFITPRLNYILVSLLLALLIIPVNPYGFDIITAILRTLDSDISSRILEWKPFQFGHVLGLSIFVGIVIMLGNINTKNTSPAERFLFFAWLFAGLVSLRYLVFAQFIGLSLLAVWLDSLNAKPYRLSVTARLIAIALLSTISVAKLSGTMKPIAKANSAEEAVLFIKNNYSDLNILNDYNSGGHFIFHIGDKNKLFVDGRAGTAYEESVLNFSIGLLEGDPEWIKVFDIYKIDAALLPVTLFQRIDLKMFFKEWKKVYTDESYVFVVRPEYFNGYTVNIKPIY